MMSELEISPNPFQELLESFFNQISLKDALEKFRAKAWDHFQELGLPDARSEVFRYVRLRNLYAKSFFLAENALVAPEKIAPFIYPECKQSYLVFINGRFSPALSCFSGLPKKVVVQPITEALKTYGALLTNQWAKALKEETDPFAVLNAAIHQDGSFIYIPPKTVLEHPIQLINVIHTEQKDALVMPRVHIFMGAQSEGEFISSFGDLTGQAYWMNMVVELSLDDDAHVRYNQVVCNTRPDVWHFDALRATLKRNSTLKTINITNGAAAVRNDYRVQLNGENGEADLNGIWMLDEKREAHTHVLIDHQAPHCRSMQLFKGALSDFGRSSFEGKILVQQAAQKTDAFQLNNNLLLSERALAYSKPNLEIFADDVKASHGATVGQLDAEQMFYLKTRGLSERDSKSILVYGYCKEVIDMIKVRSLLEEVSRIAQAFQAKG